MIKIQNQEEFTAALKTNPKLVVKFGAPWCGPCKAIQPLLEKLEPDFPNTTIALVDIDVAFDLAKACGVSCVPTLVTYREGEKVDSRHGFVPERELRELLAA